MESLCYNKMTVLQVFLTLRIIQTFEPIDFNFYIEIDISIIQRKRLENSK